MAYSIIVFTKISNFVEVVRMYQDKDTTDISWERILHLIANIFTVIDLVLGIIVLTLALSVRKTEKLTFQVCDVVEYYEIEELKKKGRMLDTEDIGNVTKIGKQINDLALMKELEDEEKARKANQQNPQIPQN